jgi:hypothetical protein
LKEKLNFQLGEKEVLTKYISIFLLCILTSVILFFIFGNFFDGGDAVETAALTFGSIIVILLSFLISLMFYLLNLVKTK